MQFVFSCASTAFSAAIAYFGWWLKKRDRERQEAEGVRQKEYSGASLFSSKIKCGTCGGWYSAKVWHSTDKYRKVIYRCNMKYGKGKICNSPHVTEEQIKGAFVKAVNRMLKGGRMK